MHSFYLDAIRNFEGYTQQATWDYAQHTNGFGTRALYPGEVIDKVEAEKRFRSEVASARSIVEKAAPDIDEGTKAALTSLTYNAGTSWIQSGLGDAVRRGDLDSARDIFQQYNKAGGQVLPGLVNRRAQEALWIGNPDAVAMTNVASSTGEFDASGAVSGAQDLPPVIVDPDHSAREIASLLRNDASRTPSASEARAVSLPISLASRGGALSVPHALAGVSGEALMALVSSQLGPTGTAEVARLAQLGRGSELAGTNNDRRENETRRV